MRFPRIVLGFVLCHWAVVGYAQTVVMPPTSPPGKLIPVEIKGLEGGDRIYLKASPGGDAKNIGLNRGVATGVSGDHVLYVIVFPKDGEPREVAFPFTVSGDVPHVPPKPAQTLKELAGADADAIAVQLAALARVLQPADSPYFPVALASSLERFKANRAYASIIKQLGTLTDHAAIVAEVGRVVAELGGAPPVPPGPVTVGTRRIVILHETNDDQPEDAALYVTLQNGPVAAYAREKGHLLDILDDDPDNQPPAVAEMLAKLNVLGVPPPSLFILDKATGAVIHKQPRPATADEILTVVKTNGG
jgi:hypothetical protein